MALTVLNAFQRFLCEVEQWLKEKRGLRNTFGDRLTLKDEVLVYEGDRLLFKSKGHIVNQGLIATINLFAGASLNNGARIPSSETLGQWTMRVGTGVGVTVGTMTSLIIENATAPNTRSGQTTMPSVGTYRVAWICTWNAGTLPALVVTEMGLRLYLITTLQSFGFTDVVPTNQALFSRLSSSDGDFTAFTINIAVPLTIEWRLTMTFA